MPTEIKNSFQKVYVCFSGVNINTDPQQLY
jgi:hypothetical protein